MRRGAGRRHYVRMDYQFSDFDTAHFRAEPRRTALGPWTVQHLSFGTPATADRVPLVFLGGAFQNAWSFLREVKHFLPQRPIILVDLPGQGQNEQISTSLGADDLADLLRGFFDAHEIPRAAVVGLSYGSGIAYTFAQRSPDQVDRLILGAATERLSDRICKAVRASFWYLDQRRDDTFASFMVDMLLNLPLREVTGVSDRLIAAMRQGMLELTDAERLRFRHNSERRFGAGLGGALSCRTLVCSAKFDHFTSPAEGRALADRCPAGEFVIIERGDHLVPVENPRTALAVYDAFLNDRPLGDVAGVLTGAGAREATRERRLLERRPGRGREGWLRAPGGAESAAALLDYNAHGCLLALPDPAPFLAETAPVRVFVPSIGADGDAVILPDERGARAVFVEDAFGTLGRMPAVTVQMTTPSVEARPGRRASVAQRLAELGDD